MRKYGWRKRSSKEHKEARRYKRFYDKLTMINLVIFNAIVIAFGIITYLALYSSASLQFLSEYDESLNAINEAYEAKQENFPYLLYPLYDDSKHMAALQKLIADEQDIVIRSDIATIQSIVSVMKRVCELDRDVTGVYLYKPSTQTMYAYHKGSSLVRMSEPHVFSEMVEKTNYDRLITGAHLIPDYQDKNKKMHYAYGIGGNLLGQGDVTGRNTTNILIVYNQSALVAKIPAALLENGARFCIATSSGDMIYDSNGVGSVPDKVDDRAKLDFWKAGTGTVTINGKDYYKKAIVADTYGYTAYYYLPRSVINRQSQAAAIPIFLLVSFFFVASIAIYRITLRLSGKRISQIEKGMGEIGKRNFEYRMPVGKENDELTLVAKGFNDMCDQLQDTIDKVYLYNIKQREASLYALQTSINPHFLYNTLEAVRSKLEEEGSMEASEMIVMLSRLFEYQVKGETYVAIDQELEVLEMYVRFFSMRYDERFQFVMDIRGDVGKYMIPKYTLQPIMENYFIHGIRQGDDNHISIAADRREDDIYLIVEDDGLGIAPDDLSALQKRLAALADDKKSLGLINVHQRLRYTYGVPYGIEGIESGGEMQGTRITLRIKALQPSEIENILLPERM